MMLNNGIDPTLLMDYRVRAVQNLTAMVEDMGCTVSTCVDNPQGVGLVCPSALRNTPKGGTSVVWMIRKDGQRLGYVAMHFGQCFIVDSNIPQLHGCEPELHLKWLTQLDVGATRRYRNLSEFVTFTPA
uniref:Uncharacterized protein n=1 Tax=Pseudomonas phage vB_PaeS_HTN2 TaxID=3236647 RepID=A0AB39AI26_9VIRU